MAWELQNATALGIEAALWKPAPIASGSDLIKESLGSHSGTEEAVPLGCLFSTDQGTPIEHSPARCSKDIQSTKGLPQNHQRAQQPSGEPRQSTLEHRQHEVATDAAESMSACSQCGEGVLGPVAALALARPHKDLQMRPSSGAPISRSTSAATLLLMPQRAPAVHTGERPYKRGACEKASRGRSLLSLHRRVRTRVRPYACAARVRQGTSTITRVSPATSAATRTRGPASAAVARPSPCTRRSTVATKPLKCGDCAKASHRRAGLALHQRAHTSDKPFECGHTFCCPWDIGVHQRTHSGEKWFRCSECGKAFSLYSHLMVHQPNRREALQMPPVRQDLQHCLIIHRKVHPGEKALQGGKDFCWNSRLESQRLHCRRSLSSSCLIGAC